MRGAFSHLKAIIIIYMGSCLPVSCFQGAKEFSKGPGLGAPREGSWHRKEWFVCRGGHMWSRFTISFHHRTYSPVSLVCPQGSPCSDDPCQEFQPHLLLLPVLPFTHVQTCTPTVSHLYLITLYDQDVFLLFSSPLESFRGRLIK